MGLFHCDEGETFFPEAVIVEILARLPVRSLLKFRSVSRSWLRLISSDYFIRTHLEYSRKDGGARGILFTECYPVFELKRCSVESMVSEKWNMESEFDHPGKHFFGEFSVLGSVNGLVCIGDDDHIFVWNPSTRKALKLPTFSVELPPRISSTWGFGFSQRESDYKTVGILSCAGAGAWPETVVMIHSLRAGTWKRINGFNQGISLDRVGKYTNGKIHFPSRRPRDGGWEIVSLDLDTEKYGTVAQPSCWKKDGADSSLDILNESLCVLRNFARSRVDVWVMGEYCVGESWIKVFSVPYAGEPQHPVPLTVLPDGEILLFFGKYFTVYDRRTGSLKYSVASPRASFLEAEVYVESLVSPYL